MESDSEYFRANVAAMIMGDDGRVLALKRLHGDSEEWQLPQGGLQPGEDPRTAIFREVLEETSIPGDKLDLLDEIEEWLGYELPEAYRNAKTGRGQVQKWFLFRFIGDDTSIKPDNREFSAWQWMTPKDLIALSVAFRRAVYGRVCTRFASALKVP